MILSSILLVLAVFVEHFIYGLSFQVSDGVKVIYPEFLENIARDKRSSSQKQYT